VGGQTLCLVTDDDVQLLVRVGFLAGMPEIDRSEWLETAKSALDNAEVGFNDLRTYDGQRTARIEDGNAIS